MNLCKVVLSAAAFTMLIAVSSASAVCTNANVVGVWGFFVGASAGQFTSDGSGNLTGSETVSQNGIVSTLTFTGNYSVAKNCTGTITLNFTGGGSAHNNFVLDNGRKGAQVINTDSGSTASGFALSQGAVTCGLTGVRQTFAANLIGQIPNNGPIAYVFQILLDGKGNVSSGSGTFDVNGTYYSAPTITGTYTENSDCTGTLQITPSGLSTLNFNFVVVSAGKEILLLESDANTVVGGSMQQ
jgi:hypothetical protein